MEDSALTELRCKLLAMLLVAVSPSREENASWSAIAKALFSTTRSSEMSQNGQLVVTVASVAL